MTIFWYADQHPFLDCLAEEFKSHFLAKNSEIASLRLEHLKETHFLMRPICVNDFGRHVELDQRYVKKFVGCNGDESLQIDGRSRIEGTREPRCD